MPSVGWLRVKNRRWLRECGDVSNPPDLLVVSYWNFVVRRRDWRGCHARCPCRFRRRSTVFVRSAPPPQAPV